MIVIKMISFLHHLGFSGMKSLEQHSCLLHSQDVLKPLNDAIVVLSSLEVPASAGRNAVPNVSVCASVL